MVSYGHFTAMQVRGGRVRELAFHLVRLAAGSRRAARDHDAGAAEALRRRLLLPPAARAVKLLAEAYETMAWDKI